MSLTALACLRLSVAFLLLVISGGAQAIDPLEREGFTPQFAIEAGAGYFHREHDLPPTRGGAKATSSRR